MVLVSTLALVLAMTAATPAPNPFTLDSPTPSASPGALPEIGRVRVVSPACAAMRDLVIPSWSAALQGDKHFADTRPRLRRYAQIVDDPWDRAGVSRDASLHQLGIDSTHLLADAQTISKALGDPRISARNPDPQVQAMRAQLEQLYEVQMGRAKALFEFVTRENRDNIRRGLSPSGFSHADPQESPTPVPGERIIPGMPILRGVALGDVQTIDSWSGGIDVATRAAENRAAKTFLPIAQGCR